MKFGSPHEDDAGGCKYQHGSLDKDRMEPDIAVVGDKKERKSGHKERARVENFQGRIGFVGVVAGKLQKMAGQENDGRHLEEYKVILLGTPALEQDENQDEERHEQDRQNNGTQYNINHFIPQ
jgi:hypothetical protein